MCHKICSKSKVYDQHNQADIPPKWCWVAHNKCYWGTCVLLIPPTDYTCSHISCNRWPSCIQPTFALPRWPAMAIFISDDLRLGFNSSFSRSHNSIHRKENQALIGCQRHTSGISMLWLCVVATPSDGRGTTKTITIRRIRPLANDHLEGPAICKWSCRGSGLLQMIFWRDRPL